MTTKVMTFRFPEELAEEIASRAKGSGKDRTAIVVEALTQAFGLPLSSPVAVTVELLQQQLHQLEERLAAVAEQLTELRQIPNLDRTALLRIATLEQVVASFQLPHDNPTSEATTAVEASPRRVTTVQLTGATERGDRSELPTAEERLQLLAQIEQQSRTLNQILSASPDLIWIQDQMGRLTYINREGARSLGFEQNYVLGKTCLDLGLIAEVEDSLTIQPQIVFSTGRSVTGEFSIPTAHGTRKYEYIFSPIFQAQNGINSVVCIARDITERKQVEQTLRESEAKYRNLFESANDSIFIIDASNRQILNANWNAARRLGYTRQELLQLAIRDIEAPMEANRKDAILKELRVSGSVIFEHVHRCKDGTEMPVEVSSRVIEYDGRLAFQSFVRDITDRKQTEAHLRLLESAILNASDAIVITEAQPIEEPGPIIVYVNQGFTQMTGYRPEEVIGKTPRILQGTKTGRDELDRIRIALSNWQPITAELVNYHKDGTEFWVEMSIVPIFNKNGQCTHWVAVQRNINDRKQTHPPSLCSDCAESSGED
jgi:PAS domain S-box-containing protein